MLLTKKIYVHLHFILICKGRSKKAQKPDSIYVCVQLTNMAAIYITTLNTKSLRKRNICSDISIISAQHASSIRPLQTICCFSHTLANISHTLVTNDRYRQQIFDEGQTQCEVRSSTYQHESKYFSSGWVQYLN